jgi:hypothetical protein
MKGEEITHASFVLGSMAKTADSMQNTIDKKGWGGTCIAADQLAA